MALVTTLRGAHEPPPGTPSFIRSSVESVPEHFSKNFLESQRLETIDHGHQRLPLRSAVESIPTQS